MLIKRHKNFRKKLGSNLLSTGEMLHPKMFQVLPRWNHYAEYYQGERVLTRRNFMKSSKGRKNPVLTIVIAVVLLFGVLSFLRVSPFLFQLVFNHDIALKKSDNRISILLLGIGGGNHDGPNLTDTIIYASLDPDKNKVSLVSIPRDLWIQDINGKINSAYALGEDK